jgi:hypothetical protein
VLVNGLLSTRERLLEDRRRRFDVERFYRLWHLDPDLRRQSFRLRIAHRFGR